MVDSQIQYFTKHIVIKYHHFWSFIENGDVKIKHVDTKEHITDIFTKPLYLKLFVYLGYNHKIW